MEKGQETYKGRPMRIKLDFPHENMKARRPWIPKTQFAYQMIPKKKEGEVPGPGKAWSSNVGEYQDRKEGGGWLENCQSDESLLD